MALAIHVLAAGFAGLGLQLGDLAAQPRELGDRVQSDGVQLHALGGDDSHAALRRVHGQVQVLDGLLHHLDVNAADGERFAH